MLEIEQYYDIEEREDLEIWKREYNIPRVRWRRWSWNPTRSGA
jgi:hypothetical protein